MDVSKNSGKNPQNGWNTLFELDDLGGKPIFLETSMYVFGLFTYVFLADFHGKLVHPQSLTNGTWKWWFPQGISFSRVPFSGSRGVLLMVQKSQTTTKTRRK